MQYNVTIAINPISIYTTTVSINFTSKNGLEELEAAAVKAMKEKNIHTCNTVAVLRENKEGVIFLGCVRSGPRLNYEEVRTCRKR